MKSAALFCSRFSGACAALGIVLASGVMADPYPAKPIRVIVPFSPGGMIDNSARVIAAPLAARLGQQLVIDNRPGASGNIGTQIVARAAPDGYTLLVALDATMVINPLVFQRLPFDAGRDFAPVTKLGDADMILVAHPSLSVRNLSELIAQARTKKSVTFPYGTAGVGTTPHLVGELLKQRAGIALEHIPYKGGGQAIIDGIAGHVPLVFTMVATAQQYVKAGRLVGLGVPSAKRSSALPDVPTFAESGLAGFDVTGWSGILAPAKTPRTVIDGLQRDIAVLLHSENVKARYLTLGIEPVGNTPEEFAAQIRADRARWEHVVKTAHLKLQ